ncbi:hypothetical protein [Pseudomonas sp. RC3H12]|uniref:hypothetical protein n=1 Tax=Pseudomonas sp. RC3H12 TaxID=2834406 RepID=UPI001BDF61BC|nr:hypothetical protein [Pseudomonas sp. RC3H12]QWA28917.1 hypothetical protein KHO27_23990 [Pseudomonas sp. RC3H12]
MPVPENGLHAIKGGGAGHLLVIWMAAVHSCDAFFNFAAPLWCALCVQGYIAGQAT